MKKFVLAIAVFAALAAGFAACKKSDDGNKTGEEVNGFDKTAMLSYYADSLIQPGYATLQQKIAALQTASNAFTASPSATTQAQVKTAYEETHLQYERVAAFQFGPAETALLDVFVNYSGGLDYNFNTAGQLTGFSIDTASIEQNIASGTYNLQTITRNNLYAQGFPALNYLYFAPNAVQKFSTNSANRTKYINDVLGRLKTLADKVTSDWSSYRSDFVANTKTNVGSPIGNIVNQLAYQMDLMKGPRLGWPFGKQSNGTVFAIKCEAYYAGISVKLANENLAALKKLYTANGSGKGISNYLVALGKTSLNNDVLAQFDVTLSKINSIPDPLSTSLTTQATSVDAAYKEVQKLLTLLKTDVASATAVQITFMDNDGD